MIHVEHIEHSVVELGLLTPMAGPLSIQSVLAALESLEERVSDDGVCVSCLLGWTQSRGITLEILGGTNAFVSGFLTGVHASLINEREEKARTEQDDTLQLWVNAERTVLLTRYVADGTMTVATRDEATHTWGPPTTLTREQ